MRLEDKFFKSFFYLFLIAITISMILVATILFYYSENYIDERTAKDVIHMEKKNANSNIYSMNVLLSNMILKLQVALKEALTLYINLSNETSLFEQDFDLNNSDVYNIYELEKLMKSKDADFMSRLEFISFWMIDKKIVNFNQMDMNMKKQLYIFSLLTHSFMTIINSNNGLIKDIYFLFEETDLFVVYPFTYFNWDEFFEKYLNDSGNPSWCTDEKGNIIEYYKFRCRPFYRDILEAQKGSFDFNSKDQKNRRLFITPPYPQFGRNTNNTNELTGIVFTICIKFNDVITNKTAYICGDSEDENLFKSFDMFNEKLIGFVSVSAVGFNEAFYFPQLLENDDTKTLGEFIYRLDNNYYLEEKTTFLNVIQKYLTSNYINYINERNIEDEPMNVFDDLFIDKAFGNNQKFYSNNIEYNYCLYPIVIENFDGKFEHVLSLIYIYNKHSLLEHMLDYQIDSKGRLIFQLILYIFFGSVLLYIISLYFKLLAKFIVVPIKNVHYMLEGINIGGEYRLKYLNGLKKKQEDNLEKLNKINQQLMKKNMQNNKNMSEINTNKDKSQIKDILTDQDKFKLKKRINKSNSKISLTALKKRDTFHNILEKTAKEENKEESKLISDSNRDENTAQNLKSKINSKNVTDEEKLNTTTNEMINSNEENDINNIDYDQEYIDSNINYEKKYDSDGIMIEKELNFYDFDEELLQYRPVEIDNLVQSLLNLKSALILTSKNQEVENIIGYTNSEYTFSNFKNKSGKMICQSNIGNLQSRLSKYDKAIYHLALSLQNVDLKKLFSSSLSDELDESDSLLHMIELNYRKNTKERDINKLVKKQQRGKSQNFSQKNIETLINSRYNKLIIIYYKFFSLIQKNRNNYEKLSGYFMHTNFHTINYYNKILIQYIYLCFISNDLVKIGESILDYIEFLIKFKLKNSKENNYIMNIHNKDIPEIKAKQIVKRKYFDKIINWINLFDSYAKQINENSALGNYKNVLDAYAHNLQSNQNQFDSGNESASVLLFQINLQRYDFLRGKFALACKEYNDALGFMINAAKKKRIVIDGLIKKRALKHIAKIAEKLKKSVINNNYSKLDYNNIFQKEKIKNNKINDKKNSINNNLEHNNSENEIKPIKLIDKVYDIIEKINNDINETNEKQLKDLIILIDCNYLNKLVIDSYIDVSKTVMKNYMMNKDRIGVFFLINEYRIICPMVRKEEIDVINFCKKLDESVEKLFKKENMEYTSIENEVIQEKIKSNGIDSFEGLKHYSFSNTDSSNESINNNTIRIEDTIKSMNYCLNYLKMKEISANENYFIYFCSSIKELMNYLIEIENQDYLNNLSYESNTKKKIFLQKEKKINFLLVGKYRPESEEEYKTILYDYFGEKSELIPFDNMKKIKSILSSNNIINDNIFFPNELYQ